VARIVWDSCAPWSASGYGQQTAIWTQKLKEMGHEVILSTYWGLNGAPMEWNGMPILPGFGGSYCSPSLQQHCKHADPDLVITLGDIWVKDPGVLSGLPVAHWLPADCRPMSTADRNVVEAAAPQLIAMSRFGEARFRAAGFSPVHYVPHAIQVDVFKPPEDRQKLREAAGIGPDMFTVGCNAANNDAIRKALPEIMLAFARFLKDRPSSLLALHTGVHQDGGQDLEVVAENLGITDRVKVVDQYRYTAGLITPEVLNDWYGTVDVLCAASFGEGFGIPIIEAQACGTPVITTKCSAMEELSPLGIQVSGSPFWNGVHRAWWIRPDIRGLYEAFHQAYDAREDVDRAALRKFVTDGYSVEHVAQTYMKPVVDTLLEFMAAKGRKVAA
jgi:glycosyltransferase involved in cell wall biosynthesis